jgi:predicted amidohydrolase YtcJ
MDVPDAPPPGPPHELPGRLLDGLRRAAAAGLTEITEMGMRDWRYLDALDELQKAGHDLPVRVRIYLASGLAEEAGPAGADARRAAAGAGSWVSLDGVKFYADGWLGPRTCAMNHGFADQEGNGILFLTPAELARRIAPLAARGWRIATHAIGDRGVTTVLDAYDLAWDHDRAAIAAAAPRIEHASLQSAELISRLAGSGAVACLQPSFAVTDVPDVGAGLDTGRAATAYPWAALAAAGAPLLAGSDYPIEVLEPLPGLARLVNGRSDREGFRSDAASPPHSRLTVQAAYTVMSDPGAGRTLLSADPRAAAPGDIDKIEVLGTAPVPF